MITEILQNNAKISIVIIAILATLISTLATKFFTNQAHLHELKKRQKELQEEMKKNKDNPKLVQELQMEMLTISGTMMKSSFKPILITMVPFLILFYWIRSIYNPVLGSWFWYYLVTALVGGMIFRKVFKLA